MKFLTTLTLSVLGSLTSFASFSTVNSDEGIQLHAKVFDLESHLPVAADVNVILFYNSDFIKDDSCKAVNGEFTRLLDKFGWYMITLAADGYLEISDTLWILSPARAVIEKNYYLSPRQPMQAARASLGDNLFIESEEQTQPAAATALPISISTLSSTCIYFPLGKCSFPESARGHLIIVAELLKENPGLVIEIQGHTDSNGPTGYNLMLSQWRADAVAKFLTEYGVNSAQLVARGFGEDRPMNVVQTPEGRAKNRRVEFAQLTTPMDVTKSDFKH